MANVHIVSKDQYRRTWTRWLPPGIYTVLALLIMGKLLGPGYIFSLDMGFPLEVNPFRVFAGLETGVTSGIFSLLSIQMLQHVIPLWLLQKLLLFSSFFLAGLSMHHLVPIKNDAARYFAGVLYVLNPFTFVRFMTGHWLILLGYALIPFCIVQFLKCLKPGAGNRQWVVLVLLLTVVGVVSSHMFIVAMIIVSVIAFVHLIRLFSQRATASIILAYIARIAVALCLIALVNSYWIVISLADNGMLYQITEADLEVFQTQTGGVLSNLFLTVLTLHGFWRVPEAYRYITDLVPFWQVIFIGIFSLIVCGLFFFLGRRRYGWFVGAMACSVLIGLFLSMGSNAPWVFKDIYLWMFENVPVVRGFREPLKFLAMVSLGYAVLGGMGTGYIYFWLKKHGRVIIRFTVISIIIVLPLIYSGNMLMGIGGAPVIKDYPADWQEVKEYLSEDEGYYNVLVLPWHAYMYFDWIGRITVNPAIAYFGNSIIQGRNIEVGTIQDQSTELWHVYLSDIFQNGLTTNNLGNLLAPINIKYILLLKESNYMEYDYLRTQSDIGVVLENDQCTLFENRHTTSLVYFTPEVSILSSPLDIQSIAETSSLQGKVYLQDTIGMTSELNPNSEFKWRPLEYRYLNRFKISVVLPREKGFVVFCEQFNSVWLGNGHPSLPNLGIINALRVEKDEQMLIIEHPFTKYRCYSILSALIIAGLIISVLFLIVFERFCPTPSRHNNS